MEERTIRRGYRWSWVLVIATLFAVFGLGIYIGYEHRPWVERVSNVAHKEPEVVTSADFEPFWKAWNIIKDEYPFGDGITDQDRVWGAINGLVSSLNDPYSTFFSPTEKKNFDDEIEGSFGGIGMEVGRKENLLTVITPIKGTPAERAGIRSGDIIFKIDNTVVADMPVDEAIDLIRGEPGTTVHLTLYREGEPEAKEFPIVREKIEVPVIDGEMLDGGIYVIHLYNFNANSSSSFRKQ